MTEVNKKIQRERNHQRELWGGDRGDDNNSCSIWNHILASKFGELSECVLVEAAYENEDGHYAFKEQPLIRKENMKDLEHSLVQVTAVGHAWLEWIERNTNDDTLEGH